MRFKLEHLKFIILYALSVLLIGVVDLLVVGFSINRLVSAPFWFSVITTAIANLLVLLSAAFTDIEKKKKTNSEITEKEQVIKDFIISDLDVDFQDYIDQDNLQRKIKAYKLKINGKLLKIEDRANRKDKSIYLGGNEKLKSRNRYCRRVKKLKEQLSDTFINANIHYLKVDYYFVKKSMITNNYSSKADGVLIERSSEKLFKDLAPKFTLSFIAIAFINSFTFAVATFDLVQVYNIVAKLFTLVLNYIWGKEYSDDYINELVVTNLNERIGYIKDYLHWKMRKRAGEVVETNII